MAHRLEEMLNASADDIMEAICRGFRAQTDVKGKLAELYLARQLESLRATGFIDRFEWHDKDGMPDFEVFKSDHRIVIECKNVRSGDRLRGSPKSLMPPGGTGTPWKNWAQGGVALAECY
jgi:hypothetical protein